MDDTVLRQYVIDELEFEPSVNAAHIGVAVDKGVVTLTGHVGSYAESGSRASPRSRKRSRANTSATRPSPMTNWQSGP